jgi:oligopeptide transport system permease protein
MNNKNFSKDDFEIIGKNIKEAEKTTSRSITYWQDVWIKYKENKPALVGLLIIIIITLMAIFAPILSEHPYDKQYYDSISQKPNAEYFFGTDDLGRDLFTRCWVGARTSLIVAVIATVINVIIGVIYGGLSGYIGGKTDIILMRIIEIIYAIPQLLWVILLIVVMKPGIKPIIIAISITGWGGMARIVRGQVLQLKQMEFVLAAKALGADTKRVLIRHLIPNTMGPIIVNLTFQVPSAVFTEAFLSYLGLGIPAPMASWGSLAQAGTAMLLVYPH